MPIFSLIPRFFAGILALTGIAMIVPAIMAFVWGEKLCITPFAAPALASFLLALPIHFFGRSNDDRLAADKAFAIVGSTWIAICAIGAVPLFLSNVCGTFINALFESVSAFTTTGATIISGLDMIPKSINLWRCEMHWLGGMGIIALTIAIMPLLGAGGYRLIKAETSGPEKGKLTSKISDTAKILWSIYIGFTVLAIVLFKFTGLSWYNTVCHAFTCISTGGFSTRDASLGAFCNPAAEWVAILIMILGTISFALYVQLFRGKWADFFKNSELRSFLAVVLVSAAVVAAFRFETCAALADTIRTSLFTVTSVISTTGLGVNDYTTWPYAAQMVIFALFFIGGCSGSTAGGIKVIRWTILAKQVANECKRLVHPHGIFPLRINGVPAKDEIIQTVASFIFAYFLIAAIVSFIGAIDGLDPFTAITAAFSMMGNIGPAFGSLGPSNNMSMLSDTLKFVYMFAMLAGRLEIYTLLILIGRSVIK